MWDKKCESNPSSGYNTLWIVDLDTKDKGLLAILVDRINKCRAKYSDITRDIISTANGYHIITIGFDLQQFKQILITEGIDYLDVHKDNPTLLYYAENGRKDL
jgi:hypothetical protein